MLGKPFTPELHFEPVHFIFYSLTGSHLVSEEALGLPCSPDSPEACTLLSALASRVATVIGSSKLPSLGGSLENTGPDP